jgi:hypothetical protein
MCENEVLRRIFGPKREEVTGGWRGIATCFSRHNIRVNKSWR